MMRRQRFIYTLPSQDDSSLVYDSDNTSIITSQLSFPETIWPHVISPDPEPLIPYYIYQYPLYEIPPEQLSSIPCFDNQALNALDTISHYKDEFVDLDFITQSSTANATYGDGFLSESYATFSNSVGYENTENVPEEIPSTYPMVTNYGTVSILLRHLIRVDISAAKAVYVTNPPATCVAAINATGLKSCVIHPNGRVLHDGREIQMTTLNKRAKICRRGVVFTSTDHCLSYLVDASGTKTTAEKFRDLDNDFSLDVFYGDPTVRNTVEECYNMVNASEYKNYFNGDEVWFLGGFRIKQNERGDVKITKNGTRQVIRSSPTAGQISVKTLSADISVNRYPNNYFAVRKGDKQVTASIKGFNVQNGTQKAGFNSCGRLALM